MKARAFTLIELLLATSIFSVVTIVTYSFLGNCMILFAKNTAINVAHQQARVAVLQIEQDIHSSISLPMLVDAARTPVTGTGPSAGISFQLMSGGPFKIAAAAAAGQPTIKVQTGSFVPKVGQRLCLPMHQIELDIASVGGLASGTRTLTLASNLPRPVSLALNNAGVSQAVDVTAFITDRVAYVVSQGELRYYGRGSTTTYSVMADDITAAAPFSTPQTAAGAPYFRFVAAINLTTADSSVSNRGYKAANMFINSMVPCRTRLCVYQ